MENIVTKNMYENESTFYREFNQLTLEQIEATTSFIQEETIYRSVSLASSSSSHSNVHNYNHDDSKHLVSITQHEINKKSFLCTGLISSSSSIALSRNVYKAPELPDLLMLSHFEVSSTSDIVFNQIEKFLQDTNGLSYDFNINLFQVCFVQLNSYRNACSNIYL